MIKAIQIQYDENMEQMFEYASKAGFRWISVGFGTGKAKVFQNDDWKKIAPYIAGLMKKYGLRCIQTHLPCYDLRVSAEVIDDLMEIAIKRAIKTSADLGAKWCVAHPRSAVNQDYSSKAGLQQNLKAFSEYAAYARETGIGLAVENMPVFSGIFWMRFFGSDYEDLCELVDSLNDPNVSVCWDFGHAHMTKFDQEKALKYVGKRISCTHIHNNYADTDWHHAPSIGNMNWKKLMPILKEVGYEGPLTLEVNYGYENENSLSTDYGNNDMLESFISHNYNCVKYLEKFMG